MPRIAFHSNSYSVARGFGRASRAVGVMACGLALLQACSGSDAVAPVSPSNATPVSLVAGTATVGTALDAPVRISVTGSDSKPVAGAVVRWEAADGGKVSSAESTTDGNGIAQTRWTLGTAAGLQTLTARVAGLSPVIFGANATADRAALVKLSSDLVRITLLGDTVHVSTTITDQYGNAVATPATMVLESGAAIAAVGTPNSVFIAKARGTAIIKATADTASSRVTVLVDPATPSVSRVSPDTLTPGAPVVIEGTGFALATDAIDLAIGGLRATITKSTASRIEAVVPTAYGCIPTGATAVTVTIASASGQFAAPLRTASRITLAKGESANILDADQVRCTELVNPAGGASAKYIVAVINTSVTAAATSGFELRGAGAGAMAGKVAQPTASFAAAMSSSRTMSALGDTPLAKAMASLESEEKAESQHTAYLESQRALSTRFGSPAPTWRAIKQVQANSGLRANIASARAAVNVGDTITVKAVYATCASGRDIRARVVYTGAKSLVLEDVASPRAGTMDDQFRAIGSEFDNVQYPLLQNQVADPLAMNAAMGGDGRVTMLFTRYVNDSLPGLAGFVSACNFYPKGTFAASNEDEIFYARIPNAGESSTEWRRSMRSTVVHEGKHLASFAVRFVNSTPFEESWLEESLGRVAEELYARTFANGGTWKGHTGFQTTVRCELYECDDRPLTMWKHFSVLHQYFRGVDTLTPIGAAANGDFTFYASGWSLVRWAIDQYATDEIGGVKALVRGGQQTGLSNLAQRTGHPAGEMLADWALANAVSSISGFVPSRSQLTFPSWNTSDVFAGLAATYPGTFVANPLRARAMSFGAFTLAVPKLRAFSSSYFSFEGNQTGSQLIELRGENGAVTPPSSLRIAIVRVE